MTLEVVKKCKDVELDLLIFPSRTSHHMQLLDAGCFGPFKRYFRKYKDRWTRKHRGDGAPKHVLTMWVSKGLKRALSKKNIMTGFRATGILPYDSHAMDKHFGPSNCFQPSSNTIEQGHVITDLETEQVPQMSTTHIGNQRECNNEGDTSSSK